MKDTKFNSNEIKQNEKEAQENQKTQNMTIVPSELSKKEQQSTKQLPDSTETPTVLVQGEDGKMQRVETQELVKAVSDNQEFKNYIEEKNEKTLEKQMSEDTDLEEDEESVQTASEIEEPNIEKSKFIDSLEHLTSDDTEKEKQAILSAFFMWGLGFTEDRAFDRQYEKFAKKGYERKSLRAARNMVSDCCNDVFSEALCDYFSFKDKFQLTIDDCIKTQMELNEVDLSQEWQYVKRFINVSELNAEDYIYSQEDLSPETLALRLPEARIVETESKFGKALEKLLESYGNPIYYNVIRQAFCEFAVGIIDKDTWRSNTKAHRRQFTKSHLERVEKYMTDELFTLINVCVIYGTEPQAAIDELGKVTMADYEYIDSILNIKSLTKDMLLYADDVEPLFETEKPQPKQVAQPVQEEKEEDLEWTKNEVVEEVSTEGVTTTVSTGEPPNIIKGFEGHK